MSVSIRRLGPDDAGLVLSAEGIFDSPATHEATHRFLAEPGHHLLMALEGDRAVGFVSGVEMTHPDKGTELFLYELGVAADARGQGIGRRLVEALRDLAVERGCYGMWVLTDDDNHAALATYRSAGGSVTGHPVMLEWGSREEGDSATR
jgi:aminoglycoside 3-N-acetyltransferase I